MAGMCRALFSIWPFKQIGEKGCSGFLFPPFIRNCLLPEQGEARLVLSSYSTPTDLEPLAAVWEPKKGSGGNGSNQTKIRIRWGRQISYFKKENKLSKDCASKDNILNAPCPLV